MNNLYVINYWPFNQTRRQNSTYTAELKHITNMKRIITCFILPNLDFQIITFLLTRYVRQTLTKRLHLKKVQMSY